MAGPWEKFKTAAPTANTAKPWEKFASKSEEPPKANEESLLEKGSKFVGGAALGVAEGLNPLSIPHGVEVLGRAAFTESGGPIERLQKASEKAVIPAMRFEDVGRDIRTTGRVIKETGKSLLEGKAPNVQDLAKIQAEEQAVQNLLYGDPSVATGQMVGEVGTGLVSLAGLAKGGVKLVGQALPKAVDKVKKSANLFAFESLKPQGKAVQQLTSTGRAEQIGSQLLKDKITSGAPGAKKMLARVEKKLDEYGERVGYYAETADKAISRDSSLRGIPVDELASEIELKVIAPLLEDPSTRKIAENVADWVDNLKLSQKGQDISFQKAQDMKGNLAKKLKLYKASADDLNKGAFEDVYGVINNQMETRIGSILEKAAPDITNDFKEVKTAYHNLKPAKDFLEATVARQSKNRGISPTDYYTAGTGGLAGAILGGPTGVPVGLSLGIANRVVRTRGNQVAAGALDTLSELIKNDPNAVKDFDMLKKIGAVNFAAKVIGDAEKEIKEGKK